MAISKPRRRRLFATAVALAVLAGGSVLCLGYQIAGATMRQRQAGAEKAALAAMSAMVGPNGRIDGSRVHLASEAAERVAASHGTTVVSIRPSMDGRSLAVVVADDDQHRSATAYYVPPGEPIERARVVALSKDPS